MAVDATGNLFIADLLEQRDPQGGNQRDYHHGGGQRDKAVTPATGARRPMPNCISPIGVAVDATGNLFIADSHNNIIRKVGTNGIITTVAGNGTRGGYYGLGDGGAATNAELNLPCGVAVDATGNLFIADLV